VLRTRTVQSNFSIVPRNEKGPPEATFLARMAGHIPRPMRELLNHIVAHRSGALCVLLLAAFLEAYGDSCFQSALYRASGMSRAFAFVGGAVSLAAYGLVVNAPRWEFGKLLGVYVVLFFLLAQIVARVRFGQTPTLNLLIGGALIVAGGCIISLGG